MCKIRFTSLETFKIAFKSKLQYSGLVSDFKYIQVLLNKFIQDNKNIYTTKIEIPEREDDFFFSVICNLSISEFHHYTTNQKISKNIRDEVINSCIFWGYQKYEYIKEYNRLHPILNNTDEVLVNYIKISPIFHIKHGSLKIDDDKLIITEYNNFIKTKLNINKIFLYQTAEKNVGIISWMILETGEVWLIIEETTFDIYNDKNCHLPFNKNLVYSSKQDRLKVRNAIRTQK